MVIIVIRKEIEEDFKECIGERIEKVCDKHGVEIVYVYQSLEDISGAVPRERKKPWGTGQAVFAAKNEIDSPFAVINADDYYGKEIFTTIHDFLNNNKYITTYCMAGFVKKHTI